MAKYAPLERYLRRCKQSGVDLTFAEIERIIGALLPNSAQRAEWWGNEQGPDTRHVQCLAWRAAGYRAALIQGQDRVRFTRLSPAPQSASRSPDVV